MRVKATEPSGTAGAGGLALRLPRLALVFPALILKHWLQTNIDMPPTAPADPDPPRRDFLKNLGALTLGSLAALAPPAVGLQAFLRPLGARASGSGQLVRVTSLDALPADGVPRRFAVVADQVNAWNRTPAVPVGAVYLCRTGEAAVKAFNVVCPHAGCIVDYTAAQRSFLCPCHNSTFALDGSVNDPKSPSPRGLDELGVEIRNEREVWVRFQNFRPGAHERIPA